MTEFTDSIWSLWDSIMGSSYARLKVDKLHDQPVGWLIEIVVVRLKKTQTYPFRFLGSLEETQKFFKSLEPEFLVYSEVNETGPWQFIAEKSDGKQKLIGRRIICSRDAEKAYKDFYQ